MRNPAEVSNVVTRLAQQSEIGSQIFRVLSIIQLFNIEAFTINSVHSCNICLQLSVSWQKFNSNDLFHNLHVALILTRLNRLGRNTCFQIFWFFRKYKKSSSEILYIMFLTTDQMHCQSSLEAGCNSKEHRHEYSVHQLKDPEAH